MKEQKESASPKEIWRTLGNRAIAGIIVLSVLIFLLAIYLAYLMWPKGALNFSVVQTVITLALCVILIGIAVFSVLYLIVKALKAESAPPSRGVVFDLLSLLGIYLAIAIFLFQLVVQTLMAGVS